MSTRSRPTSYTVLAALALYMALQITGLVLGGELYDRFGYVRPFAASVGMAVLALLLAMFLIPETLTQSTHPNPQHPAWTQELRTLPARPVFFLLLFISFGAECKSLRELK